jgi:AcrR family transcriptional regulator
MSKYSFLILIFGVLMHALPEARRIPRQSRSRALVEAILEATARILSERGYANTNTNLVAERAGVSIGSVYQYFPNKDALISALHERHALQMYAEIERVFEHLVATDLASQLAAIVHAWLSAHLLDPELHRVLEQEFPFFDAPADQSPADQLIFRRMRQLLQQHQQDIVPTDLDLATWMLLHSMESLIHAAVIHPSLPHASAAIEPAIVNMLLGYLYFDPTQLTRHPAALYPDGQLVNAQ